MPSRTAHLPSTRYPHYARHPHHVRHPRHAGGFTLTECLLSGLILAMASGIFAAGMSMSARTIRDSRDREQAAVYMDTLMNKIALLGPNEMMTNAPTGGQLDERFGWQVMIEETGTLDLYQVDLTVFWQTGSGPKSRIKSAKASTLIYEKSELGDLDLLMPEELTDEAEVGELLEEQMAAEQVQITWEDLP